MEPLKKSMKNSIQKYQKTRDPASQTAVAAMKIHNVQIHPGLTDQIDEKEIALMDFKAQLGQFKPQMSVLETAIFKTKDEQKIKQFKSILNMQKQAAQQVIERKKVEEEYRKLDEEEQEAAD